MGLETLFDEEPLDLTNIICHSGAAPGADTAWENIGERFGVKTRAYSYKTDYHKSPNKVEISEEEYNEGVDEANKANRHLGRWGIHKFMNLIARDWIQVKYSDQIFAVGYIVEPGKKSRKGYYSKSKYQTVDGGTGYAVMMGINHDKDVFVFDQRELKWFRWSYATMSFLMFPDTPKIATQNFAGIGTRELTDDGVKAIVKVYEKTFSEKDI